MEGWRQPRRAREGEGRQGVTGEDTLFFVGTTTYTRTLPEPHPKYVVQETLNSLQRGRLTQGERKLSEVVGSGYWVGWLHELLRGLEEVEELLVLQRPLPQQLLLLLPLPRPLPYLDLFR